MNQLRIGGSFYFLTFPVLMVISVCFVPFGSRAIMIDVGRVVSQSVALLAMVMVSTNKKGNYAQVYNWSMQLPTTKDEE